MTAAPLPDLSELKAALGDAPDAVFDDLAALATRMQSDGKDRESPVREIFGLLGDRWSTLILLVLARGRFGHAALKRTVSVLAAEDAISQRVLTLKLKALERNGLVRRMATDDIPPRVDYELTPLGAELYTRVDAMIAWISSQSEQIQTARAEFDQRDI